MHSMYNWNVKPEGTLKSISINVKMLFDTHVYTYTHTHIDTHTHTHTHINWLCELIEWE